jgi:hypothetical protein
MSMPTLSGHPPSHMDRNSLRTAAAELPTFWTSCINSVFETPNCLLQYFISHGSRMLILLRSAVPRSFREFIACSW